MDTNQQVRLSLWVGALCRLLAILIAVLASCAALKAGPKKTPVLSVCAALERSATLDGQEVSIRGEWMHDMEHVEIHAYKCSRGSSEVDAIRFTSKGTNSSLESFRQTLERNRFRMNPGIVVATFRGILKQAGPGGSGHLGTYRADLDVFEISDIRILSAGRRLQGAQ